MFEEFKKHVESQLGFLKKSRLIVAISGGVDSVVLAYLCRDLGLNFGLAHCNFNLRGEESNADEDFVLRLGEYLDVEVFIQGFDTQDYAKANKCSIQMSARELRYNWFAELARQLKFDYILTAHHADDNLETFLINFTRGTGLNGLTGIPAINDNIVRPLLQFSRKSIEAYAQTNKITWREDSSNASRKYLRNKLRQEVVPVLKEINPLLLDSFQNTLGYLNDASDIVRDKLHDFEAKAVVSSTENDTTYKISEFKKVNNPKAYAFEMFKDFGFTEWNDVVNLLDAKSGKYVISNTHRLIKHREFLILSDLNSLGNKRSITETSISINGDDTFVETPIGHITISNADRIEDNTTHKIFVSRQKLSFPLELKPWETGDYFYPLGMKGKKKVSKYLKDEKLSPIEKENIWVLKSNGKIVWVVGKRADERFKVNESTKQILKVELKK